MNLNDRFNKLRENLKLDPQERLRAEVFHNRLGELLIAAGVAKRTRLQGSLARKTMLPPLKDIDKIIELVDDLRDLLTGPNGPRKAMGMIRDALAPHLPGVSFEIKKHALGISVPGESFAFDAVPAFNPEDGSRWIVIADTEDEAWEPSNTYVLIDTIAARNQLCDGKFIHQVRMIKQACRQAGLAELLPGLHIETFAYAAILKSIDHSDAVAKALRAGADMLGSPYSDPTGVDQISDRLDARNIATSKSTMQRVANEAERAIVAARAGDEGGAATIWSDIFGDAFPRPNAGDRSYLEHLHRGGAVLPSASTPRTPTTRAWRCPGSGW